MYTESELLGFVLSAYNRIDNKYISVKDFKEVREDDWPRVITIKRRMGSFKAALEKVNLPLKPSEEKRNKVDKDNFEHIFCKDCVVDEDSCGIEKLEECEYYQELCKSKDGEASYKELIRKSNDINKGV